jgi:DUF1680 family protein
VLVRIPGWAQNKAIPSDLYRFEQISTAKTIVKVNGQVVDYTLQNGYASISRKWKKNDVITVDLPMEVKRVTADQRVSDDVDKVALQRGPIIYCAEWADNDGKTDNIILPVNTTLTAVAEPNMLNGITVLKGKVPKVVIEKEQRVSTVDKPFTAIPYYAWANRGKGEMMIWFPEKINYLSLNQ